MLEYCGNKERNDMYPTIDKYETGKRIKALMDANGYSVRDIQEYLRLACVQSVYHWLDGKSLPTVDNFYALSVLFNVSVDSMICGNKCSSKEDAANRRLYAYYIRLNKVA